MPARSSASSGPRALEARAHVPTYAVTRLGRGKTNGIHGTVRFLLFSDRRDTRLQRRKNALLKVSTKHCCQWATTDNAWSEVQS